ncbi:hypothetical protein BYT27DRAFT_7264842 [Phlegmacium glaucopus]|nr:hypothetical protein BYT27DRAFT_7264842 [Phlegmacium glaucopus]
MAPLAVQIPDRWVKQHRSTKHRLAYVLFTTRGDVHALRVYYNWTACDAAIIAGSGKTECSYRGYDGYTEADTAWSQFQQSGILPTGCSASRDPAGNVLPDKINELGPGPCTPSMLQQAPSGQRQSHCGISPSTHRREPLSTPGHHMPSRQSASRQGSPAVSQGPQQASNFQRASGSANNYNFWIVVAGYDPSVYQGQSSADQAMGPFNDESSSLTADTLSVR